MVLFYLVVAALVAAATLFVRRQARKASRRCHEEEARYNYLLTRLAVSADRNDVSHYHKVALAGRAAEDRDDARARNAKWQARHERVQKARLALKGWRGRKAPYVVGFLDALGLLGLIDLVGLHGEIGSAVVAFAKTLFTTAG